MVCSCCPKGVELCATRDSGVDGSGGVHFWAGRVTGAGREARESESVDTEKAGSMHKKLI